jgi:hypothetical protein
METYDYTPLLLKLAKDIRKISLEVRSQGLISTVETSILKNKIEEFEQSDDGSSRLTQSYQQIVRSEWSAEDILKTIAPKIKEQESYRKIVKLISERHSVNVAQADFWVSNFTGIVARESLNDATEDKIIEITISFMMDLEGSPKYWSPTIWLNGLTLKDDSLKITESFLLRKAKASDLEREWNLLNFPFFFEIHENPPHSVLQLVLRGKNQPEINNELEKIILSLRLFKVGSIESVKTYWGANTFTSLGFGVSSKNYPSSSNYRYQLTKDDAPKLSDFLKKIPSLIPLVLIGGQGEIDYSAIAIQRYNDALMKPEIFESRLSFGIMALEALYLKKEIENGELEHRLSQRVARLLGLYESKPLEVFNTLKRSYAIRSSYVHGSPIPKEDLKQVSELTQKVLDYVRLSIILFLQLKNTLEKDRLLNLIDNSLLSEEAFEKLKQELKENCLLT